MAVFFNIIFAFASTLIIAFFNLRGLFDSPKPTLGNSILSILFLCIWFLNGVLMGKLMKKSFIFTTTIFWSIGLLLSLVCMYLEVTPLWAIAFMYLAPLNGLGHFDFLSCYGYPLAVLNTIAPLFIAISGYVTGLRYCKKNLQAFDTKNKRIVPTQDCGMLDEL